MKFFSSIDCHSLTCGGTYSTMIKQGWDIRHKNIYLRNKSMYKRIIIKWYITNRCAWLNIQYHEIQNVDLCVFRQADKLALLLFTVYCLWHSKRQVRGAGSTRQLHANNRLVGFWVTGSDWRWGVGRMVNSGHKLDSLMGQTHENFPNDYTV